MNLLEHPDILPLIQKLEPLTTDALFAQRRRKNERAQKLHWPLTLATTMFLILTALTAFLAMDISWVVPAVMGIFTAMLAGTCFLTRETEDFSFLPLAPRHWNCKDALAIVQRNPAAREYRDRVVNTGRQLYMGDFEVLEVLEALDSLAKQLELEKNSKDVCAELHGLTTP